MTFSLHIFMKIKKIIILSTFDEDTCQLFDSIKNISISKKWNFKILKILNFLKKERFYFGNLISSYFFDVLVLALISLYFHSFHRISLISFDFFVFLSMSPQLFCFLLYFFRFLCVSIDFVVFLSTSLHFFVFQSVSQYFY